MICSLFSYSPNYFFTVFLPNLLCSFAFLRASLVNCQISFQHFFVPFLFLLLLWSLVRFLAKTSLFLFVSDCFCGHLLAFLSQLLCSFFFLPTSLVTCWISGQNFALHPNKPMSKATPVGGRGQAAHQRGTCHAPNSNSNGRNSGSYSYTNSNIATTVTETITAIPTAIEAATEAVAWQ